MTQFMLYVPCNDKIMGIMSPHLHVIYNTYMYREREYVCMYVYIFFPANRKYSAFIYLWPI
jgi:hypothetical protein